jgi:hypothetical protein
MQSYSEEFAGKPANAAEFRRQAESLGGQPHGETVSSFFQLLTEMTELPTLELRATQSIGEGSNWHVKGQLYQGKGAYPTSAELLVETDGDPVTHILPLGSPSNNFDISSSARPRRLIADPRNQRLRAQGPVFSIQSFERELDQSLIVYGTGVESASHREAAELLQRRIASQWSNTTVPIKADRDVSEEDMSNHLLLVGRPNMNLLADRWRKQLPVQFGAGSFTVADQTYAHPASAVIAAAANPVHARYSLVVFAGLGAESTRRAVQASTPVCEVLILPAGGGNKSLVLPARELIVEFPREGG